MEKCIYIGNLYPIKGEGLSRIIMRLLEQENISANTLKNYHYGELYSIKEHLLDCFNGYFFDIFTLKRVIMQIVGELQISIEDLRKEEFTKSFGPGLPTLKKEL